LELETSKKEYVTKVNDLIWSVELGNNLQGSCSFCPSGILESIKTAILG